jgi:hypothetical protein
VEQVVESSAIFVKFNFIFDQPNWSSCNVGGGGGSVPRSILGFIYRLS